MIKTLLGAALSFASLFLLSTVSFAPAGCTITTTGDDGGSDSSSSGDSTASGETVGDQCSTIDTALCNRAIACLYMYTELAPCLSDTLPNCCDSTNKCDQLATSSDSSISTCATDYSNLDCNSIATGVTPSSCSGLPTPN